MVAEEAAGGHHRPLLGAEVRRGPQGWLKLLGLGAALAIAPLAFLLGRAVVAPQVHSSFLLAASSPTASGTGGAVSLWRPVVPVVFQGEPLAKHLVRLFDIYLMNAAAFHGPEEKALNVGQWLAPEFVYDTVGFPSSKTLRGWCVSGEESAFRKAFDVSYFSQMLFFGDEAHSTTTSYGTVHWSDELFGIPAPKGEKWTYFRVLDFYHVRTMGQGWGLIDWNFMMIDFADLLRRVGRPVLPKAPLPEGLVLTAEANDGVPAPLSVVVKDRDSGPARAAAARALTDGWAGESDAARWWHQDLMFYGPGGIGVARGLHEYEVHVLGLYRSAFANRTCETRMLFCEGNYCGAHGVLWGHHVGTWVGQQASNRTVGIRFGMHFRVVDGLVKEGWAIFDIPGFFGQLGRDFFAEARDQAPSS